MPGDGYTPQINRTNSLFPYNPAPTIRTQPGTTTVGPAATVGPTYAGTQVRIANPRYRPPTTGNWSGPASDNVDDLIPRGFHLVSNRGSYIIVEPDNGQARTPVAGDPGFIGPTRNPSPYSPTAQPTQAQRSAAEVNRRNRFGQMATSDVVSVNGVVVGDPSNISARTAERLAAQQSASLSVFSPLNVDVIPDAQFVMSYGPVVDPVTGRRTTATAARGLPQTPAGFAAAVRGMTPEQKEAIYAGGETQNMMTISAGVQWFRRLSVKDPGAYNQMVIALRNAGYLNGQDEDLPLNGWSRAAGAAFAYAAQDLSDAAAEGEQAALLPWLQTRGQGFADAMAEQQAEQDAPYTPVDRSYQDPELVKATAKAAAVDALGRALTPEEEARFEASFRGKEDGFYDQVDAVGRAQHDNPGAPGARVAQPNLGAQADAFINGEEYDTERAGERLGEYAQAFQRLMGGRLMPATETDAPTFQTLAGPRRRGPETTERAQNLRPVTARQRLQDAMDRAGEDDFTFSSSDDSLSRLRGLDNPYGAGASAYEPNTVLFSDYAKAKSAVDRSKLAEQQQADQFTDVGMGGVVDFAGGGVVQADGKVSSMVAAALELASRNVPYVWGGTSRNGVDCSGLIYYAAQAAGITDWKRYRAVDYGHMGTAVTLDQARPGDLVYIDNPGDVDHVGLYIGNGQMVQAPTTGDHVRVTAVGRYTSIRRVFSDAQFAAGATASGLPAPIYNGQPYNPTPSVTRYQPTPTITRTSNPTGTGGLFGGATPVAPRPVTRTPSHLGGGFGGTFA